MKNKKWDPIVKSKIVLECLEQRVPVAEICNKYQLSQSTFSYWLREFHAKAHKAFESKRRDTKEQRLMGDNAKLKRIIAELTIELKKTELELSEGGDL